MRSSLVGRVHDDVVLLQGLRHRQEKGLAINHEAENIVHAGHLEGQRKAMRRGFLDDRELAERHYGAFFLQLEQVTRWVCQPEPSSSDF